jgi:hypothetical protein
MSESMKVLPGRTNPSFHSVISATSARRLRIARADSSPSDDDPTNTDGFESDSLLAGRPAGQTFPPFITGSFPTIELNPLSSTWSHSN